MVFCTKCGENNEKEAKFCSNCGQPMNQIIQPQTPHNDPSFSTNQEQDVHSFNEENKIQRYEMPKGFDYGDIENGPYKSDQQPNNQSEVNEQQFGSQQPNHFQNPITPPLQQQGAQRYQPIKKNSNAKVWIISGASVLIVLILAISFIVLNHQKSTTFDRDPKTEQIASPVDTEKETNEDDENQSVQGEEKEKTQIIKESMPKVFTILTEEGMGSGFLYKKGGYIVTNAHVVAGYSDVIVRNSSGQESIGKVIGLSDYSDIALIYSEAYKDTEPLPLELSASEIGIEVIAIGSPQGFENTATFGYLTGSDREMSIEGYNFVYDHLYQIDAQIDQGSSGGPLFDASTGKVIGINSLIYTNNETFGFSIPLHTVAEQFDNWISNPMSPNDVIAVNVYDDYAYNSSYDDYTTEDYSGFWDYYDQYFGDYSNEDPYTDDYYYEDDSYTEDYYYEDNYYDNYWNNNGYLFDESSLTYFMESYFEYYKWAMEDSDFYWIEDMVSPDSYIYNDLQNIVEGSTGEIFDDGLYEISSIDIYDDYALVTTYEEEYFYDENGDYVYYQYDVEYTIILDEYGNYLISDIYYYQY